MKVRFVGGPFGGQVKEMGSNAQLGRNEITYRGPKKMTRQQKYEYMRANQGAWRRAGHTPDGSPVLVAAYPSMPMVEARYRLAMRAHNNGEHVSYMPCMHPDGSLFYEYVDKSKREL